jgi:CheY-like chemotaxis protein
MIRVFLLDDHEVVRRGLRELLESEGDIEVVGESGSAQESILAVRLKTTSRGRRAERSSVIRRRGAYNQSFLSTT